MCKVVTRKAKKFYPGSAGKPMTEVYYKGKFIDAVGTKEEVSRIRKNIKAQEMREKRLNKVEKTRHKKMKKAFY